MSNAEARLSQAAVDLLIVIAETPSLAISGTALGNFHVDAGAELIAAGALQPDGFEPVTVSLADHDDAAVSVSWNSETGRHEYFSPTAGMVPVEDDVLRRFRLQMPWLLGWIVEHLGLGAGGRPVDLVSDRLWDLGDVWLGERKGDKRRTAIYFARRLGEPGALTRMHEALRSRAGRPPGVILTSSPTVELGNPAMTGGCAIVPIRTCALAGVAGFSFDAGIIRAAAHGSRPTHARSPVQADAEFRVVRVGNREFRFGGDKQRQVIQ